MIRHLVMRFNQTERIRNCAYASFLVFSCFFFTLVSLECRFIRHRLSQHATPFGGYIDRVPSCNSLTSLPIRFLLLISSFYIFYLKMRNLFEVLGFIAPFHQFILSIYFIFFFYNRGKSKFNYIIFMIIMSLNGIYGLRVHLSFSFTLSLSLFVLI